MTAIPFKWPVAAALCLWIAAVCLMVSSRLTQIGYVRALVQQGSPAPALSVSSASGYVDGKRHFVAIADRGETYRWIAATQELVASGAWPDTIESTDNFPEGRVRLLPRLYTAWLAGNAYAVHHLTGDSLAIAAESIGYWEPLTTHFVIMLLTTVLTSVRFGAVWGLLTGVFVGMYPSITGVVRPGVVTPTPWALFLSGLILADAVSRSAEGWKCRSAVLAGILGGTALWLDPAIGFPSIIIVAIVEASRGDRSHPSGAPLIWALTGVVTTTFAWWADGAVLPLSATELRCVHPLYALAWAGIGLLLGGWNATRTAQFGGRSRYLYIAAGIALIAPLAYCQVAYAYPGWLFSSPHLQRIAVERESILYPNALSWMNRAPSRELLSVLPPLFIVVGTLVYGWIAKDRKLYLGSQLPTRAIVTFGFVAIFACINVRWFVCLSVLTLPLVWSLTRDCSKNSRHTIALVMALALSVPTTVQLAHERRAESAEPTARDVEELLYRQFAHWLASHSRPESVVALAPPELSDSLLYHGGLRVTMSTAWQTYPGQLAASRILSAPESTEAEAVLQARQITHVILPSWDRALPILVKAAPAGKETLYDRLHRWVLPLYLRPMAYRLPNTPGFESEKMAVFRVVPAQDEALSLARLAEYFAEVGRNQPAVLAANVLSEAYPDDANALIARATVHLTVDPQEELRTIIKKIETSSDEYASKLPWDRRVQRAIVLAMAGRRESTRKEVGACLDAMSFDMAYELSPLQAYRLNVLSSRLDATYPDDETAAAVARLGSSFKTVTE